MGWHCCRLNRDRRAEAGCRGRSFWFALQFILFFDVLVFTFGYLVELPRLKNQIRSVDPHWIGWAAALVCYPPFNSVTHYIFGSTMSDFPQFDDPTIHAVLNALLLLLMGIYASASVALGFKGSNLTHRGIVARGPYAFIRHPAYICKNAAWWIGSLPLFAKGFENSWFAGVLAIASMSLLVGDLPAARAHGGGSSEACRRRVRRVRGASALPIHPGNCLESGTRPSARR